MADLRYYLMSFKVEKNVPMPTGRFIPGIITRQRLIQAQTEIEALEKFKITLKPNEKYLSHENETLQ